MMYKLTLNNFAPRLPATFILVVAASGIDGTSSEWPLNQSFVWSPSKIKPRHPRDVSHLSS